MARDDRTPDGAVQEVVGRAREAMDGDEATLGDLVAALGRSQVGLLLVPGLLLVTPLAAIPGFCSVCGIVIALISVQMVAGRSRLWLPGWMLRLSVGAERARRALRRLDRAARWLDRHTRPRLEALVRPVPAKLLEVLCMFAGGIIPALELLPLTSSILGAAVTLFAVALLTRDGLVAAAGLAVVAAAAATVAWLV